MSGRGDPYEGRPYRERGPIRGPVLISSSGVVLALAITLPWIRAGGGAISWSGLDVPAPESVLLWATAGALVVLGFVRRRVAALAAILLSLPIAWRGVRTLRDGLELVVSEQTVTARFTDVSFGAGTWLVFAAAFLALAGGVLLLGELSRAGRSAPG